MTDHAKFAQGLLRLALPASEAHRLGSEAGAQAGVWHWRGDMTNGFELVRLGNGRAVARVVREPGRFYRFEVERWDGTIEKSWRARIQDARDEANKILVRDGWELK